MSTSEVHRMIPVSEHPQLATAIPDYVEWPIGIDTKRLRRLAVLGCLDPDVQFRVESGESSTFDTTIVGHIGNTALGGATRVTQARLSDSEREYLGSREKAHRPVKTTLTINSSALRERVQQEKGKARDAKTWARYLNAAVTDSIEGAAWRNLVGGVNKSALANELVPPIAMTGAIIF